MHRSLLCYPIFRYSESFHYKNFKKRGIHILSPTKLIVEILWQKLMLPVPLSPYLPSFSGDMFGGGEVYSVIVTLSMVPVPTSPWGCHSRAGRLGRVPAWSPPHSSIRDASPPSAPRGLSDPIQHCAGGAHSEVLQPLHRLCVVCRTAVGCPRPSPGNLGLWDLRWQKGLCKWDSAS